MNLENLFYVFLLYLTLNVACFAGPIQQTTGEEFSQTGYQLQLPLGLPAEQLHIPEDNPLNADKIALGRALFFDSRLSADGSISCASCHFPQLAFSDNRQRSLGIGGLAGMRNAPSLINRGFSKEQFWDGRVASLEEQAQQPLFNQKEMGMAGHAELVSRINAITGYREWFKRVFHSELTITSLGKAIASFERTLFSGNTKYDKFKAGNSQALSASEKRGLTLFEGKARCNQCHSGFNFTDEKYHNIGVNWDKSGIDLGRYSVSFLPQDIGAFKTPTLREIEHTAPYMHDGSIVSLKEVIDFYDKGGILNPFLDAEMQRSELSMEELLATYDNNKSTGSVKKKQAVVKLNLSLQDKADLLAFLKTLNGEGWQHIKPPKQFPQ